MLHFRRRRRDLWSHARVSFGFVEFFALSIVLLLLVWLWGIMLGYWISPVVWASLNVLPSAIVGPLIASTVGALTLVYSLGRGRNASRDQYTLNLIGARFEKSDYQNFARIVHEWTADQLLTPETSLDQLLTLKRPVLHQHQTIALHQANDVPPFYALVTMLNFWEHVCTAYVDGRINRRIFEDSVRDLIVELFGKYSRIIGDSRVEHTDGSTEDEAAKRESSNFEHLCAVWFLLAPAHDRKRLVYRLGDPPSRLLWWHRIAWRLCKTSAPVLHTAKAATEPSITASEIALSRPNIETTEATTPQEISPD